MSNAYREPSPPTHVTVARALIERSLRVLESISSMPTGTWPEVYTVRNELQRTLEPRGMDLTMPSTEKQ